MLHDTGLTSAPSGFAGGHVMAHSAPPTSSSPVSDPRGGNPSQPRRGVQAPPQGTQTFPLLDFLALDHLRRARPFDRKWHQKCHPSSFTCQSVLSSALGTFPSLPPLPGSQVTEQPHFASKVDLSALSRKIWDNSISQQKLL